MEESVARVSDVRFARGPALRRLGVTVVSIGCIGMAFALTASAASAKAKVTAKATTTSSASSAWTPSTLTVPELDPGVLAQLLADVEAATAATLTSLQPLLDDTYAAVGATRTALQAQLDALLLNLGVPPGTVDALALAALVLASPALAGTCATLAALTPIIPRSILGIPLNTQLLAGILPVDKPLSDFVYKQTVGLTAALAPAQLALLKLSWTTTYRKSSGGTIVRSVPGYLGIPTLMDVDGALGYDLCGLLTVDATTGKITQEITRLPLSAAKLTVDVAGSLTSLGDVSLGYLTPASWAPTSFKAVLGLGTGGALFAVDNTVSGPGPSITQRIGIGTAGAVDFSWTAVPKTAHVGVGLAGTAITLGLNTSSRTKFGMKIGLGAIATINETIDGLLPSAVNSAATISLPGAGLQAIYDGPAGDAASSYSAEIIAAGQPLSVKVNPLPAKLDSCALLASIACSNVNSARSLTLAGLSSMHFTSSSVVNVEQVALTGASCSSGANQYAKFTGKQLDASWNITAPPALAGHLYVDTGGNAVSGCANALTQTSVYPAGFTAGGGAPTGRLGSFTFAGLFPNTIIKSGAITCPALTMFAIAGVDRTAILCPTPPVNTAIPTITGTAKVSTPPPALNSTSGTYSTQNAQTTVTRKWLRCDAAGANCGDIGVTTNSYKPVAADLGSTLRVMSTATNSDGTASASSNPTAIVGA